jgi:2-iminobutanoate/2-iminopropanoate deaminase
MQYFAPRIFNLFNFSTLQLIFMKKIIKTDKAPAPVGPYNQAIIHNDTLYASGQIALDPVSGALITETIEAETTQVMSNVQAILEEAGLSFKDVVKVSVFVTDINNFARINAVYATYFDEATAPARELVQVTALPKGGNIEISVIAAFD